MVTLSVKIPSSKNKGHIHLDPKNPLALIHDDGTAHYSFGVNGLIQRTTSQVQSIKNQIFEVLGLCGRN